MNALVVGPPTQTAPWGGQEPARATIDFDLNRPERVMLDPSFLLVTPTPDWLRDPKLRDLVVISRALADRIENGWRDELAQFVDKPMDDDLVAAIAGIQTFSWRDVQVAHPEIIDALLELEGGDIFADEYAYLVSHSWMAMLERTREWVGDVGEAAGDALHHGLESLEAFTRAGVKRFNVADVQVAKFLKHARGKLPKPVVDGLKHVQRVDRRLRNAAKRPMLVAGGAAAAIVLDLIPELTVATSAASAISAGLAIIAGDP